MNQGIICNMFYRTYRTQEILGGGGIGKVIFLKKMSTPNPKRDENEPIYKKNKI